MNPLHLKGNCLFIDNSTLSEISACPRRGMYKFLRRRQLKKNRAALFFGGAIHKALEVRDLLMKPLVDNETREAMTQALIDYYADADFEDDFRNLDYAVRTIEKYNETYKNDPLPPVRLASGELAVELPFALPVGELHINATLWICDPDENDGQPFHKFIDKLTIVFTGKIDRVCKDKGARMLLDHKTSSMGGPNFFNEFYTALQFRGYKWAVEQLTGEPIAGVIINGIICRPPTKDGRVNYDMDRHTIYISDEMVEEWQNTFMKTVAEWVGYAADQADTPDQPEQAFPIRTGQCIGKYGTCEFFDVCQLPPAQRGMLIDSPLYEDHSWSPLEDNAKPKPAKEPLNLGGLLDHLGL
jgi:PD-(D/E)XK nuclease superfamily